jgi:Txe/YoeB family toxin of toxin-antitoxin system
LTTRYATPPPESANPNRSRMLAGAWSRRISEEHRLVYLVDGDDIVILQARLHYK